MGRNEKMALKVGVVGMNGIGNNKGILPACGANANMQTATPKWRKRSRMARMCRMARMEEA